MTLDFTPTTIDELDPDRRPSVRFALVPVLAVVIFLGIGSALLGLDPHVPLLWSIVTTGAFGHYLGYSWSDLYDGVANGLLMGLQAILIIFTIYALIATWVDAGTIPAIMYYGLELLSPHVFLPVAAILAAVVAFAIGSSWTTVGTLGVAFVGIGAGLGVPGPMTVGAVISGAYAGDKQSPLSDTTNLAAGVTNTPLYEHIYRMRTGTAIAFGLSLVGFAALGLQAGGAVPADRVAEIQSAVTGAYEISVFVFVPLAITFGLALKGYPALPTLVVGTFAGVFTSMLVQGTHLVPAWEVFMEGTELETGSELVNDLLATGGLTGSAWTITVVVAALVLGGLLEKTGVLAVLAYHLSQGVSSSGSLIAGTGAAAILINGLTAQQYMSIVLPGMTLRNLYEEFGLDSDELSRAIEAAGTPTGALIPWHAGGVFMASATGVSTLSYAPYYLFGLLSPLVLFAMALSGHGVPTTNRTKRTQHAD
ncbi:arginine/ornithine antiporter ArcD [Natronobacterium gregoryi]|uniref:Na+ antiporter NhaC n=2 Tax=Natronobacterium gregoryi TaxID=44930 RepID=L0AHU0_NATGS|nr:Na+/H+ antiporter NhaC [Natronobacterium gregoryi]AFZ73478.1 Na+ antiporter NhaC [Natronobacterium gregoryi SP2]ELY68332.1 sodium/hydrogen, malic/sodium-lactate antiporter [Natronobacterium gregoryi SP2]PLK20507.1 Na+/H+ antiporter NhaC [Natronobacterium gregoryi SP2]SFI71063.1 transporter, NhaC family [Natronobacterium gregoryi]